jgi:CRISPR-associated protein Cmr2
LDHSIPLALLAADTDRTQDFVFESSRLPEIRGASRQLDDLNQEIKQMVEDRIAPYQEKGAACQVVFAGGGGLLALAPEAIAADLVQEIEALYPRRTTLATITAAARPVTAEMLEQGYPPAPEQAFGTLVRWAGTWLRRRKESKPDAPFIPALPHVERCASCQQRPANPATRDEVWGPLCDVCNGKRQAAEREYWFDQFRKETGQPAAETPKTLAEIGQACAARPGHVGFIYLDGDNLGQVLETLPTLQDYRAFSQAIEATARKAVFDALRIVRPAEIEGDPERAKRPVIIHPFEILTIGGDDIMLIVPADQALPIAATITQAFTAGMRERLMQTDVLSSIKTHTYTLSGGVVLADDHNPVRFLRDLAERLQDSAKARLAQDKSNGDAGASHPQTPAAGYLDFQVLTGDMLELDVTRLRAGHPYTLKLPNEARALRLVGRPYTARQVEVLWQGLYALRRQGFPNSQMKQLTAALLGGRQETTLFYLYQRARDRTGAYEVLDNLLHTLQHTDAHDPLPWRKVSNEDRVYSHETVLWDIAELYGYVV